ncbi:hypothetical protein ACJMK2_000410 [Sinanodonta woodiana]|uniref:Uncharacterized protein n=1 Tax=Sinanodonta woodiana TaxID=1069815 RepID=A0ABD3XPN2_SINWO
MKGHLVVLFSLCLAATCLDPVYAAVMLMTPCPFGCIQNDCYINVGCPLGRCQQGWCSRSGGNNMGMTCVRFCPLGEFCSGVVAGSFCLACGVNNCLRCVERYKCSSCKAGYTLSSNNARCISLRKKSTHEDIKIKLLLE